MDLTPEAREALRETLIEVAPVVIAHVGADERVVALSGPLLAAAERDWDRAVGRTISELIDDPVLISLVREALAGRSVRTTTPVTGRPWLVAVEPVRGGGPVTGPAAGPVTGPVTGAVVVMTYAHLAEVHRDLTAVEEANERFATLIELSRDLVAIADLDGTVTYVNRAGRRLVGLAEDDPVGRPAATFFADEAQSQVPLVDEGLERDGSWQGRSWLRHVRTGESIPVDVDAFVVTRRADGTRLGLATVQRDLRDELESERQMSLRIQEQRAVADLGRLALTLPLSALMDEAVRLLLARYPGMVTGVLARQPDGSLEMVACAVPRWRDSVVTEHENSLTMRALRGRRTVRTDDVTVDDRFPPGTRIARLGHRSILCSPILTDGSAWGVVGASAAEPNAWSDDDQTFVESVAATLAAAVRRDELETALQHQAMHDPLTALPNRALVMDRISHALDRAARSGSMLAVLLLDVDDFKSVNDGLGHGSGDTLLTEIARRLPGATRRGDTVARLGGDEFLVVCEDVGGIDEVSRVAERLLDACAKPVDLPAARVSVSVSVGVAVSSGENRDSITSLVSDADIAMYRAKRDRPGTFRVFDEAMRGDVVGRLTTAGALRAAVRAGELDVAYQPIVDLADGHLVALEALARWDRPSGEPVSPEVFIPIAEETGLIGELGLLVLRRAVAQAHTWQQHRRVGLRVNASAPELRSQGYVDRVLAILAKAGLPPELLGIEITESMFVDEERSTQDNLGRLRQAGVGLLIDDFGTGYSSLSYLQRFPLVDVLKVDRSFLGEGTRGEAVVGAVTGLAAAFGMDVCAEGVETAEQHTRVAELGCRLGQGYYLGRPLSGRRTGRLVEQWQPLLPGLTPPVR